MILGSSTSGPLFLSQPANLWPMATVQQERREADMRRLKSRHISAGFASQRGEFKCWTPVGLDQPQQVYFFWWKS